MAVDSTHADSSQHANDDTKAAFDPTVSLELELSHSPVLPSAESQNGSAPHFLAGDLSMPPSAAMHHQQQQPLSGPTTRVHRCRFVEYRPTAITCLAFDSSATRLAVCRSSGDIELWRNAMPQLDNDDNIVDTIDNKINKRVHHSKSVAWHSTMTIAGTGQSLLSQVVFIPNTNTTQGSTRLFGASRNARLIEYDTVQARIKYAVDSVGGAAWCLALLTGPSIVRLAGADAATSTSDDEYIYDAETELTHNAIALGCEDGSISLFDVTDAESEPQFICSLRGHTARVLSLCWSRDGKVLLSGAADGTIRQWDIAQRRNISRVNVETTLETKPSRRGAENDKKRRRIVHKTLVWRVQYLTTEDSQFVCALSTGVLQVYSSLHGTLLQTVHQMRHATTDLTSLSVSEDRQTLYTAGTEGSVLEVKLVGDQSLSVDASLTQQQQRDMRRWTTTHAHRAHTHDVLALAISPRIAMPQSERKSAATTSGNTTSPSVQSDAWLVSGGVDTQLCITRQSTFATQRPAKQLPLAAHRSQVSVAPQAGCFIVQHAQKLSFYRLGQTSDAMSASIASGATPLQLHDKLPVARSHTHLLDIECAKRKKQQNKNANSTTPKLASGLNLDCSALSSNARWLACSTQLQFKLFRLTINHEGSAAPPVILERVHTASEEVLPCSTLCFTADESLLFGATPDGLIQVYELNDQRCVVQSFKHSALSAALLQTQTELTGACITSLCCSSDAEYLCVADLNNLIVVYKRQASSAQYALHWAVPQNSAMHTCCRFIPQTSQLIIARANNTFTILDCSERAETAWSRANTTAERLPNSLVRKHDVVSNIIFDPAQPHKIVLCSNQWMCVVDLNQEAAEAPTAKQRHEARRSAFKKVKPPIAPAQAENTNFRFIYRYKPMMHADFLSQPHVATGEDVQPAAHVQSQMVICETPWLQVMARFPPPQNSHHKFAT